ncbi:MAG TPA: hypothetical protein IAB06_03555 [Candidatus Avacidaminococcus intestinavium]|uniref:Uncharacterized protein n=1 Tax=Candidatus Avacidaminococcus intestinavium TaxID=2840684 RepID=A0A9D1SLK3_9FIRM|nr:hypothetical protein [Candidatus Avacidaminococcus intestinavium]
MKLKTYRMISFVYALAVMLLCSYISVHIAYKRAELFHPVMRGIVLSLENSGLDVDEIEYRTNQKIFDTVIRSQIPIDVEKINDVLKQDFENMGKTTDLEPAFEYIYIKPSNYYSYIKVYIYEMKKNENGEYVVPITFITGEPPIEHDLVSNIMWKSFVLYTIIMALVRLFFEIKKRRTKSSKSNHEDV